uniref:Peptidase aspartic putative domain-containing protein n=1 Tax=Amphimedon queenslandica TaxID=400682 RepID=A0A1X7VU25_AMPQE
MNGEVFRGKEGPVAVNTRIGYVLSGPITWDGQTDHSSTLLTPTLKVGIETETKKQDRTLQRFWELEPIGILDRDDQVFDRFAEHVTFNGDRYIRQRRLFFHNSIHKDY